MNDNDQDGMVVLGGLTTEHIPANRVLISAIDKLESVVLIGWDNDQDMYFATSISDIKEILWLIEKARQEVLG